MQEYFWWAGRDDENFTVGPCSTREEAIERGNEDFDEGFYIVEAYQRPVDFAEMFNADDAIARWLEDDDQVCTEDGEAPFDLTADQLHDLQTSVRLTIRNWAIRSDLANLKVYWFAGQRNEEHIPAPTGEHNV